MTVNDRLILLEKFLKENGAYDQYCANIRDAWDASTDEIMLDRIILLCNAEQPLTPFMGAFSFADTPEGSDFWLSLAKKWISKFKCNDIRSTQAVF